MRIRGRRDSDKQHMQLLLKFQLIRGENTLEKPRRKVRPSRYPSQSRHPHSEGIGDFFTCSGFLRSVFWRGPPRPKVWEGRGCVVIVEGRSCSITGLAGSSTQQSVLGTTDKRML